MGTSPRESEAKVALITAISQLAMEAMAHLGR